MSGHRHTYEDGWPFADDVETMTITTVHVLDGSQPIMLVTHDADDGAWQILCGTTNSAEDGRVACLGCLVTVNPFLADLADLPLGWRAWREEVGGAWERAPVAALPETL